jgi:hypothetical protein
MSKTELKLLSCKRINRLMPERSLLKKLQEAYTPKECKPGLFERPPENTILTPNGYEKPLSPVRIQRILEEQHRHQNQSK